VDDERGLRGLALFLLADTSRRFAPLPRAKTPVAAETRWLALDR